ncbi:MAG: sigma-70 family RNA polymerase sigma factor [Actinomycetota bacterium]|nr:sigma-70 family RNA polymerase sigma factor [Actinomycetota bacterium]
MAADTRDDLALVEAARAGDRQALDTLLRRHHDRLLNLCRRLAGNEADALDATQEALLAIVRGLPRFDGRAAFSTWAYRVTTNACLDELRRRRRRPVLGLPDDEPDHGRGGPIAAAEPGIDGLGDRMAIERALADLPIEFRAPVVLRDLCDLDYAEIGATLGIPAGTVRSRIARGRAQLARVLGSGNLDPHSHRPTSTTTSEPELGPTP